MSVRPQYLAENSTEVQLETKPEHERVEERERRRDLHDFSRTFIHIHFSYMNEIIYYLVFKSKTDTNLHKPNTMANK